LTKIIIFILINIIPQIGISKGIGLNFSNLSFFGGVSFNPQNDYSQSYSFLFDRGLQSCTIKPIYYGIEINSEINKNDFQIGVSGKYNPIRYFQLSTSPNFRLFPYLFSQVNYKKLNSSKQNLNFLPGIGITGINPGFNKLQIRPEIQLGYFLWDKSIDSKKGLFISFKVGLSIGKIGARDKKEKEG
tara:strand:- start:60 stop:620 length:561 start_codon:yes stop_codon:yes gene_type:complete